MRHLTEKCTHAHVENPFLPLLVLKRWSGALVKITTSKYSSTRLQHTREFPSIVTILERSLVKLLTVSTVVAILQAPSLIEIYLLVSEQASKHQNASKRLSLARTKPLCSLLIQCTSAADECVAPGRQATQASCPPVSCKGLGVAQKLSALLTTATDKAYEQITQEWVYNSRWPQNMHAPRPLNMRRSQVEKGFLNSSLEMRTVGSTQDRRHVRGEGELAGLKQGHALRALPPQRARKTLPRESTWTQKNSWFKRSRGWAVWFQACSPRAYCSRLVHVPSASFARAPMCPLWCKPFSPWDLNPMQAL